MSLPAASTVESAFSSRNQAFFRKALVRTLIRPRAFAGSGLFRYVRRLRWIAGVLLSQKRQGRLRAEAQSRGLPVPGILISSVTRRCNLSCTGCYSQTLRREGEAGSTELSSGRLLELYREALSLGVGTFLIAGGEPLLRKDLLSGIASLSGGLFPVFTNGLLADRNTLELFCRGRVFPIFSLEGNEASTEQRRGPGVHERVLSHASFLKKRGAVFGFSITLTSANADSVLERGFLDYIGELGASVLFLIEFVPVQPGTEKLVLTAKQKATLDDKERFSGLPYMTVSLPGDEEAFGGCLAAGRGFLHLSAEGAVEACPFAPFSDTSCAEGSLEAAFASPLLSRIREHHAELSETRGGCALWNKGGWASSLGNCGRE